MKDSDAGMENKSKYKQCKFFESVDRDALLKRTIKSKLKQETSGVSALLKGTARSERKGENAARDGSKCAQLKRENH